MRCWCQCCPLWKELVLSPVPPPCMPLSPLFSSQAFLPLLKKAAQGSPGSALSCSKAAIINMSSYGGSIASPSGWDLMQVVSYRCSKVLPRRAGDRFASPALSQPRGLDMSPCSHPSPPTAVPALSPRRLL